MKYYYLTWLAILLSIFMYLLGGQDQMNDVVFACQNKFEFTADNVKFVCIPSAEYFGENK